MARQKHLMQEISKAREKNEFTDVVLACGSERFPVHKVIICSQSKVLHAACSKPFEEAGKNKISEQSPAVVRRMVEYFYTGDYGNFGESMQKQGKEKSECSDEETPLALRLHAQVFALAEMYQVNPLQDLAVTKYSKALGTIPDIERLLDSIPDVYQLTPTSVRALRDKAIIAFRTLLVRVGAPRHPGCLSDPKSSGDEDEAAAGALMAVYDDLAVESPEFAKDLLISYIRSPLLGYCNCKPDHLQPTEAVLMKCLACGKGGALNYSQRRLRATYISGGTC